jgi:transcriptional regulator with XRE-family HTH domain
MGHVNFEEIKRRREKKGLTLSAAAKLAGWGSGQVWANLEQGQRDDPQVSTLVKVAKVLNCKLDDLIAK